MNVPVVQVQTATAKRNVSAAHTRAYLAPLAQSEKDNSVNCSDMIDSSNPITFSEKKMFVKMCIKLQFEEYFLISRQQTI